jgi:phage terminase large subunit GpA-like protein
MTSAAIDNATAEELAILDIERGVSNFYPLAVGMCREKPIITVAEFAEKNRMLPASTPFPGPWRNSRTPYLVEPMNNMAAYSSVQRTIITKGAQLGFTAAAENVIAYIIAVAPGPILFMSGNQDLLDKWARKRLEALIDSCKLRDRFFAQTQNARSRATGDRMYSKEFVGGGLEMSSAQSAASMRSDSVRYLLRDEIDSAPRMLTTGEGDYLEVSLARTIAYQDRARVMDFSTPKTIEESSIWPEYESGDRRKFFVPCPACGHMFFFEWYASDTSRGMQWEIVDGRIRRAWYNCPACSAEIRNHHKTDILVRGEWRPTSRSYSDRVRSYHAPTMISSIVSWEAMVEKYLASQDKPGGMQAFTNLYLGEPFKESGTRIELQDIVELRGGYKSGTVPRGPVFLTAAVDVQRGGEKFASVNVPVEVLTLEQAHAKYGTARAQLPPRLEVEVCGHGLGYRTWSIAYLVITGSVTAQADGAFKGLLEHWRAIGMSYPRADGRKLPIQRVLVDSGDGQNTEIVYRFVQPLAGFFASKGMASIAKKKNEVFEHDEQSNARRYRVADVGADKPIFEINGSMYKNAIYENSRVRRVAGDKQPACFMEFPVDYTDAYFEGLLRAEEKKVDRKTRRVYFTYTRKVMNEPLDCRVANLCAADSFLEDVKLGIRAEAKARGVPADQIATINSRTAIEFLAKGQ